MTPRSQISSTFWRRCSARAWNVFSTCIMVLMTFCWNWKAATTTRVGNFRLVPQASQKPRSRNVHLQQGMLQLKLQPLVYDSLPPTTAVTDFAIGLGKLTANGHFSINQSMFYFMSVRVEVILDPPPPPPPQTVFHWCSNGSKCVPDNSNYVMHFFYNYPHCLNQPKLKKNRRSLNRDFFLFF